LRAPVVRSFVTWSLGVGRLDFFMMLLGQASCRVRASCFANLLATGQHVRVFVNLLSSSKRKRFTSLVGGAFLCGPRLSVALGSRAACTFWSFRSPFLFFWEARAAACLSALCPILGCRRLGGWLFLQGFPRLLRRRPPRPLEVLFLCSLNFLDFGLCILFILYGGCRV
jgi:hypothetical protein